MALICKLLLAHLHVGHSIYMKGVLMFYTLYDVRESWFNLLTLVEVVVCTQEEFRSTHLDVTGKSSGNGRTAMCREVSTNFHPSR